MNGFVYPLFRDKEIIKVLKQDSDIFRLKIIGENEETKCLNIRRGELIKIRGVLND